MGFAMIAGVMRHLYDESARRVCNEYLELPGLSLTVEQVRRRWDLDGGTCARILAALVADGYLCCAADGRYRLAGSLRADAAHHRVSA